MYSEAYAYVAFQYVQVIANNLVTWAFSAKYWIVAFKVQLFQAEINLSSKAKLFAWILFGGGALFTLLSTIAFIPQILATTNSK